MMEYRKLYHLRMEDLPNTTRPLRRQRKVVGCHLRSWFCTTNGLMFGKKHVILHAKDPKR